MFRKPNLSHLTGTAKVTENNLLTDKLKHDARPERSTSQMFFQPYESQKEFIYCARKTALPLTAGLILYFLPALALNIALGIGILTLGLYAISSIQRTFGDESGSLNTLNWAEEATSLCCQAAVDVLVLPASILIMLTRGISTGLKEANIYDFDNSAVNEIEDQEAQAREGSALNLG